MLHPYLIRVANMYSRLDYLDPQCKIFFFRKQKSLCFDCVFASEHVINLGQIIGLWSDVVDASDGHEFLLQMGLFAEETHLFGM